MTSTTQQILCSLFTVSAILTAQTEAQELSIVVPANNRASHFNWEFQSSGGGDVRMGQFACGSYWVAPASGDNGVTVLSLTGNPEWNDLISCDADPITESHGLLSGENNYGSYNGAENIIPNLPLTYTPESGSCISLVAAMQRNEAETTPGGTNAIKGEVADAYCVITVLPSVPANEGTDMIRPNITGATKEFLTWDDFDLSRIPTYSFITGKSASDRESTQRRWRHSTEIFGMMTEKSPGSWIKYSEGGRAFRAANLIDDYAAGTARAYHDDVLALFAESNTLEEKKPFLAAMLSYGLDIYNNRYNYGSNKRKAWSSGAGQSGGVFLPPVLLASLLRDETKANELRKVAIYNHGSDEAQLGPQELRQQTRGVTGVLLWGDYPPYNRNGNSMTEGDWRYWADFKGSSCYDSATDSCNASRGKKTAADPYGYIDGPANSPGSSYMSVSFGGVRSLAAAMILMPEIRSVVNTDAPIEYADRVLRHGLWTAPDPVAAPAEVDQGTQCSTWWSADGCQEWGVTWGPVLEDIRFAIEDGFGRFTSKHGNPMGTGGYESGRARTPWSTIIAMYDGETYEDKVVPLGTLVSPEIIFEYGSNPKAHILTPNVKAEIRYTLDGSDPTESSSLYTDPVDIAAGTEIRAKSFQSDMTASSTSSKTLELRRTWGKGTVLESNQVNTGTALGWLFLTEGDWAWSYSLEKWIYAPDPGPDATGEWIYFPR